MNQLNTNSPKDIGSIVLDRNSRYLKSDPQPKESDQAARDLGRFLHAQRSYANLSMRVLAEKTGLSLDMIVDLESGLCPSDQIEQETLEKLAKALNININRLVLMLDRPLPQRSVVRSWIAWLRHRLFLLFILLLSLYLVPCSTGSGQRLQNEASLPPVLPEGITVVNDKVPSCTGKFLACPIGIHPDYEPAPWGKPEIGLYPQKHYGHKELFYSHPPLVKMNAIPIAPIVAVVEETDPRKKWLQQVYTHIQQTMATLYAWFAALMPMIIAMLTALLFYRAFWRNPFSGDGAVGFHRIERSVQSAVENCAAVGERIVAGFPTRMTRSLHYGLMLLCVGWIVGSGLLTNLPPIPQNGSQISKTDHIKIASSDTNFIPVDPRTLPNLQDMTLDSRNVGIHDADVVKMMVRADSNRHFYDAVSFASVQSFVRGGDEWMPVSVQKEESYYRILHATRSSRQVYESGSYDLIPTRLKRLLESQSKQIAETHTAPIATYHYMSAKTNESSMPFDCASVRSIPVHECKALVALYTSTNGDQWRHNDGWLETSTPCDWYGVTCAANTTHPDNTMQSGDSEHDEALDWLLSDDLSTLTPEALNMVLHDALRAVEPKIDWLDIGFCSMDGCSMQPKYISPNHLFAIPASRWGNLFDALWHRANKHDIGADAVYPILEHENEVARVDPDDSMQVFKWLPDGEINASSLTEEPRFHITAIDLSNNQLIGSIPSELGNLSSLTYLGLDDNYLMGNMPSELGNLSKLTFLYLASNQLSGEIPPELGNLSNLVRLHAYKNELSGPLPAELGNLTALKILDLSENELSRLPAELNHLTKLTELRLSNNQFRSLPSALWELTELRMLEMNHNQLITIPPGIGNLSKLVSLHLQSNELHSLPSEIGLLAKLTHLSLGGNRLATIPPTIGNLSNLTKLDLCNNQLTELPPEISNLARLQTLYLHGNRLQNIEIELGSIANVQDVAKLEFVINKGLFDQQDDKIGSGNAFVWTETPLYIANQSGFVDQQLQGDVTFDWGPMDTWLASLSPPSLDAKTRREWLYEHEWKTVELYKKQAQGVLGHEVQLSFDPSVVRSIVTDEDGNLYALFSDDRLRTRFHPDYTQSDMIIDNSDGLPAVTMTGDWDVSTIINGFYDTDYIYGQQSLGAEHVRFMPDMPTCGEYDVYAWWTDGPHRASNTPIVIYDGEGLETVISMNQQINGERWNLLGTYQFAAGTSNYVEFQAAGADGVVIADAVRFVQMSNKCASTLRLAKAGLEQLALLNAIAPHHSTPHSTIQPSPKTPIQLDVIAHNVDADVDDLLKIVSTVSPIDQNTHHVYREFTPDTSNSFVMIKEFRYVTQYKYSLRQNSLKQNSLNANNTIPVAIEGDCHGSGLINSTDLSTCVYDVFSRDGIQWLAHLPHTIESTNINAPDDPVLLKKPRGLPALAPFKTLDTGKRLVSFLRVQWRSIIRPLLDFLYVKTSQQKWNGVVWMDSNTPPLPTMTRL
ncbi:MAG: leucine-rich repeat domain-containing protein [Chloroflexota bacterium]